MLNQIQAWKSFEIDFPAFFISCEKVKKELEEEDEELLSLKIFFRFLFKNVLKNWLIYVRKKRLKSLWKRKILHFCENSFYKSVKIS